jgi:hypothetical protein
LTNAAPAGSLTVMVPPKFLALSFSVQLVAMQSRATRDSSFIFILYCNVSSIEFNLKKEQPYFQQVAQSLAVELSAFYGVHRPTPWQL